MITVYSIKSYNPTTKFCVKTINNYYVDANSYNVLNQIFTKATDKVAPDTIILKMYHHEHNGVPGVKIVCDKSKPEFLFVGSDKNPIFLNIMDAIIPHFSMITDNNLKYRHYITAVRTYNKDIYSYDFDFSEMIL